MTHVVRLGLLSALSVSALALHGLAHEDDPKILHRKPAYRGPGYSAGALGKGGGSFAGTTFPAQNATLISWMPLSDFGSPDNGADCWGYVSPSGREYAIFCHYDGTSFVEVTDPSNPQLVATINGPDSLWRDTKTYQTYAYSVSEGGGGIQVMNLANIDNGQVTLVNTVTSGGTTATHNVAIDEESGFLYRTGGSDEGLRIYNLANPASPSLVAQWDDRYVHDAQIKTFTSGPHAGKQIAFCCSGFNGGFSSTGLSILDVTVKGNIQHVGQITWPGADYSHQAWLSDDGTILYVNDELDENGSMPTTTYIIDVTSLTNPVYRGSFNNGNTAVGHNLYVKGDFIYEANYRSGLRVFDASNPLSPFETAYFDTDPGGDGASFNGMWSNYPFLPSGVIVCSDMERGLFLVWVGDPPITFTYPSGLPTLLDPAGESLDVQVGESFAGALVPGTAQLHYDVGQGTVSVDLVDLGGGNFSADFPSLPCGSGVEFYLSAQSSTGITWVDPPGGAGPYQATATPSQTTVFSDALESASGWTVGAAGDDATTGVWVRGNPIGTGAQPEDDHSSPGTQCYFTGQGSFGGSIGENDVDDGKSTLTSPAIDLSNHVEPTISYWRWYSNTGGASPEADVFVVEISNNGSTWVNVETVGPTGSDVSGGWNLHQFRVGDFVTPTSNVRVRFIASDEGSGSIVEAAIDDIVVSENGCPDCNGNLLSDDMDILTGVSLDLDQDGTPDDCQPLSADTGSIGTILGGQQNFVLNADPAFGGELYLLLGTVTGTAPGFDIGPVHVDLNQDAYFNITLVNANQPPLVSSFGTLDSSGDATAAFDLPSGFTTLIGTTAHHAYITINPVSGVVTFASNAVSLNFTF